MGHQLVIHCDEDDVRVALIEHGLTTEFYVESRRRKGLVGNIYKGRVARVLPGMQSAFVDIGLERTAFLYVGDVVTPRAAVSVIEAEENGEDELDSGTSETTQELADAQLDARSMAIEDLLREGEEIVVQVAKEPIGTKGARITSHISLPGRNMVYLPTVDHVGVSRRIEDEEERARLKAIAEELRPDTGGLIVRTVGEGKDQTDFEEDVQFLTALWKDIEERAAHTHAPACIHHDLDLILRTTRDLLTEEFDRVLIDSKEDGERLKAFAQRFMPAYAEIIEHYDGDEALFDRFGVEMDLSRALERKVWLKSGGSIVIDEAEALTAVDVNTGRYVGKTNLEDTILKINLEAVKEVAYQLRLRNLGGLIIIDFIDMESEANRERVNKALIDELRADKARSNVLRMSELGLVEMTRKRVRESIRQIFTVPCFYCSGRGYLKSIPVLCGEILSRIRKESGAPLIKSVMVYAHPRVAEALMDENRDAIESIELRTGRPVIVKSRETFHLEEYEVFGRA